MTLRAANSKFIEELINAERLSLVGTMMSSMVHDFRNPISTIGMIAHVQAYAACRRQIGRHHVTDYRGLHQRIRPYDVCAHVHAALDRRRAHEQVGSFV